jgi:hypothetical protein
LEALLPQFAAPPPLRRRDLLRSKAPHLAGHLLRHAAQPLQQRSALVPARGQQARLPVPQRSQRLVCAQAAPLHQVQLSQAHLGEGRHVA